MGSAVGSGLSLRNRWTNLTGSNRPPRDETLVDVPLTADAVAQFDRFICKRQHRDVGFTPDLKAAKPILPTNDPGRSDRAGSHDLFKAQTQMQKLGHRCRQIDHRIVRTHAPVQIGADDVW